MTSDVMVLVRKARADWLRAQCEVAYVRVLMSAQRYADVLRREDKYRPDQPRVPAGNSDGGQWTDAGGGNQRVAQGTRGRGTVSVRIGGLAFEATPAQAMRLSNATSAANAAIARVRERDPNWKPTPSASETVEGAIQAREGEVAEAQARLRELNRLGIGGNGGPTFEVAPGGSTSTGRPEAGRGSLRLPVPPNAGLPDFLTRPPGHGSLRGNLDALTPAEHEFATELRALGNDVEIVSTGEGRTPDFKINGVPHELKTVRYIQSPTSEGVSKSISKTILRGRGQARNVIIDARKQPGMTTAIAERSIGRAFGADVKRGLESVTILTNSGPVYVLRSIRK